MRLDAIDLVVEGARRPKPKNWQFKLAERINARWFDAGPIYDTPSVEEIASMIEEAVR